jgi:hypothetical protein
MRTRKYMASTREGLRTNSTLFRGALALLALSLFGAAFFCFAQQPKRDSELTAHEWGTFTTVAGTDGMAMRWVALTGATDLPGFVEHLNGVYFKLGLRGTVRMETPVLYFYTPGETEVSVRVQFSKGLITEWYPHASRVEPRDLPTTVSLDQNQPAGSIAWDSVTIEPGAAAQFPTEENKSRYYAARQTAAAPLFVHDAASTQQEKFLFYRGVSAISVPLSAKVEQDGSVEIENLEPNEIPHVIYFERRGDKAGYQIMGPLKNQMTVNPVALSDSIESLQSDLEGILISQGLFPDEAHAMVETWKDSWFEEGARLFYIVPRKFVDSVLPLSITPVPAQTVRVFVGRMELITPATERAVEDALAKNDQATLAKYGRFLEPILETMIQESPNAARTAELRRCLNSVGNGVLLQARN